MVKRCPSCGYNNRDDAVFCSSCGGSLAAPGALMMKPVPSVRVVTPVTPGAPMRVPPPGMCFYHPSLPAVYICNRCGRAICRDDSKSYMDLVLCVQCYAGIVPPMAMAPPAPTAQAYGPPAGPGPGFAPFPGPMFGPVGAPMMPGGPARSLWGFIIAMVSGIVVLLNAGLLLAWQFYGGSFLWANIFFWICKIDGYACPLPSGSTATGNITFVLGVVIGLILIVGSILMILGYGTIGSVVVFPMAVFSLIIGGGFIAGFVLGIVGGILGMIGR
ncbi:MAG: zinc ribbon domain-containing protein [Candidatus Bathyarchaeia archaeon]